MINISRFLLLAVALERSCRGAFGGSAASPTSSATITSSIDISASPTSSPTLMSSYTSDTTHPDYPYCNGTVLYISDGDCDRSNNNEKCGWDGGDCCGCTCQSPSTGVYYGYVCGSNGYDCKDPDAPFFITEGIDCENASFTKPQVTSCSQDVEIQMVVESTSDALELANSTSCSGGSFNVEWRGRVDVAMTIHVLDGTSVRITGISEAVADGRGTVPIFLVSNGYLYLNKIGITNGNGSEGGAIFAVSRSELVIESVTFTSNTAQSMGGAIFAGSSNVTLVSTTFEGNSADVGGAVVVLNSTLIAKGYTNFHDNNAGYGGAVFASRNSIVIGSRNTTFINNTATENGGAIYIAGTSYLGWSMQSILRSTARHSSMFSNSGENISTFTYYPDFSSCAVFSEEIYGSETEWIDINESEDTVFMRNRAEGLGGAIYAESSKICCSGSTSLIGNSAQYGGALYLGTDAAVEIHGVTTFASNNAVFDGGAIGAEAPVYGNAELIANGLITFMNNTCGENGGAIHLSGIYYVVIGNATFSENSALFFGGALYAS